MVDGTITAGQAVVFPTPIALLPLIVTNGTAVLRFTTVRNRLYSVEMTPTLTPPVRWTQYQSLNGTGEAMSIKVPAPTNAPGRFFRVRVF